MNESPLYTVRQLAAMLNIHEQTVYRMAARRELPVHRIGAALRFRQDDVDAFLRACRQESDDEGPRLPVRRPKGNQ